MGAGSSKSQFSEVVRVLREHVLEEDSHLWNNLWRATINAQDVFEAITPSDVRTVLSSKPINLQLLFRQAIEMLYQVVESPFPVYFDQALNCIRVLTRILPFMIEAETSGNEMIGKMFWTKIKFTHKTQLDDLKTEGDETLDLEDGAGVSVDVSVSTPVEEEEVGEQDSLAVILVNILFNLLFLPEFTIDDPGTVDETKPQELKVSLLWAPGVGCNEKHVAATSQYDNNRVEVLRLMLAAFCDPLYHLPNTYDACASMWLEVATSSDTPYADVVFSSLLNVVLGYDPVGWGVPYGQLITTDTAKALMETAVQALLVLLDYGHPISISAGIENANPNLAQGLRYVSPEDTQAEGFNVFRKLLFSIDKPTDFDFIFCGFSRILNSIHQSEGAVLPGSITTIESEQEVLVLLWKFLEECPKFLPHLLRHCDVTQLVLPLCYFMFQGRKEPAKVGLVHICTFILLKLSGERSFGVSLNKSYTSQLPINLPLFTGNHADLLVITLHKLVVSGLDKLQALYNCFLTILCNVSPYCKTLSNLSSVKLVNLFELFTSPRFLYANESNHVYVALLLEIFNNIVQYQYEGNYHLVYAIVRRKEVFERLAHLTLSVAVQTAHDNSESRSAGSASDSGPAVLLPTSHGVDPRRSSLAVVGSSVDEDVKSDPPTIAPDSTPESEVETKAELPTVLDSASEPQSKVEAKSEPPALAADSDSEHQSEVGVPGSNKARPRFIPSQEWLASVRAELSLNTMMRLLHHLAPQLEERCRSSNVSIDEFALLDFIRQTTLVGLLPVPHPIVIRKYSPNSNTSLWFTVCIWGVIFSHNQLLPLYDSASIKLFSVSAA